MGELGWTKRVKRGLVNVDTMRLGAQSGMVKCEVQQRQVRRGTLAPFDQALRDSASPQTKNNGAAPCDIPPHHVLPPNGKRNSKGAVPVG